MLGFTSTDNSGTTGIEKYYDKYLAGTNGELLYETDLVGVNLKGAVAAYRPAEDGMNVKLTVDYGIQSVCESVMGEGLRGTFARIRRVYRARSRHF